MNYNGKTLQEIENNFPSNMIALHRELYLNNCREVIKNESAGFNLDYCQLLRDANHRLIVSYLCS